MEMDGTPYSIAHWNYRFYVSDYHFTKIIKYLEVFFSGDKNNEWYDSLNLKVW